LSLLIAALAALSPAPQADTASGADVRARPLTHSYQCSFSRILLDPTAGRFAVWDAPRDIRRSILTGWPSDFVVGDLPSRSGPEDRASRLVTVSANARVEPLRWSASGDKLLFRVRAHDAMLYEPRTGEVHAAPSFSPLWQSIRIESLTHGSDSFHREPGPVRALDRIARDGGVVRGVASVGDSTSFLIFRTGQRFRLTGYADGRRWDTKVPIAFASHPLLPEGARSPLFFGQQQAGKPFLPYALPLIDRTSGRIVGRFGWDRIELKGKRTIDLRPEFNQMVSIRDAAAHGDIVVALVDLDREIRIVRADGKSLHSWQLCEKKGMKLRDRVFPADNALPADTPMVRTEVRFSGASDRSRGEAFGFLHRPLRSNGQLVVYFHGGPTSTLAEWPISDEIIRFAAQGTAVLAVEYSGSLGGGLELSERLPRRGLGALREDVRLVTQWVRRSGFKRAFVLGDSFGGVPAAIAAADHSGVYAHSFLRAPLLAVPSPETSVNRPNLMPNRVPAKSQLEFEETVYGGARGRKRFDAELRALVRRLQPSPRLSFYFGSKDPVSGVADLPKEFEGHRSVKIVDRAHHLVGGAIEVWRDILCKTAVDPTGTTAPVAAGEAECP
jgi:hypothetical protein